MPYRSLALFFLLFSACATFRSTTAYDPAGTRAELPREEAPHPRNSLEWWYLTGHLRDPATGERYGVEYVFFHVNTNKGRRDYQMVNVALTDPQGQQFHYDYVVNRLPRLLTDSLPVRLREHKAGQTWAFDGQEGRYHLQAALTGPQNAGYSFDLRTTPTKPALLHSGTGYENYLGHQVGYYSYPRLATSGTLTVAGKTHPVSGELWYDRQWNFAPVMGRHTSWDWFSLQLDQPQEELMLNVLHNKKANTTRSNGSYYGADNQSLHLGEKDFQVTPLTYWTSPVSGKKYPATWRVQVPAQGYDLTLEPLVPQQELKLQFFRVFTMYYWEGMCRVSGTHNGQPVTGRAYVEITNK